MLKNALLLSAVALAAVGMMRPAEAQQFGSARIPVIVKATTSQFWATVFAGAREAAKVLGVKIETLGATAETDVAGEVNIVDNAVATHPTAIVVAATNAVALAQPIERATAAGIPVIMIDSAASTDKYVTFLATNNVTGGQKAADEIAACIKARTGKAAGKVAYLTALAGAQSLNDRDKGFVEQIKKYPDIKIVDHRVGNNDASKALSDTEDLLTKRPDMAGIFADNEYEGDGAGTAVADKKLGSKLCLVAFDTDAQEIELRPQRRDRRADRAKSLHDGLCRRLVRAGGGARRGAPEIHGQRRARDHQEEHRQPGDGGAARPEEIQAYGLPRRVRRWPAAPPPTRR